MAMNHRLGEWPAEVYKHVERALESGSDTLLRHPQIFRTKDHHSTGLGRAFIGPPASAESGGITRGGEAGLGGSTPLGIPASTGGRPASIAGRRVHKRLLARSGTSGRIEYTR